MIESRKHKIQLKLSCSQLGNSNIPDTQICLYIQEPEDWAFLGETEIVHGNDPNYSTLVKLDFTFEQKQHLLFEVYDMSSRSTPELIGISRTTLAAIITAPKRILTLDITNKEEQEVGKLYAQAEKLENSKKRIAWQWGAKKLMNTDGWFDKSDPFLRFFKTGESGQINEVHKTEIIMNNLNPTWKPFEISDEDLCESDPLRKIRIECWDWEKSGQNQYIGSCVITLQQLWNGTKEFELHNPKKCKKTGTLKLLSFSAREEYNIVDYLQSGQQIKTFFGINFSSAQKNIKEFSQSSHIIYSDSPNQYQAPMQEIAQILLDYDHDQSPLVYGFGGIPRFASYKTEGISHCFPCTGDSSRPRVSGIDGIMQSYLSALKNVAMGNITKLAPLIKEVMQFCEIQKKIANGLYTILLILISEEIKDLPDVLNLIVESSYLPLSIIIGGVGEEEFLRMDILNGGLELRDQTGRIAVRDMTSFVPLRNFKGDMNQFTQYVLSKIPDQFTEYMKLVKRVPLFVGKTDINAYKMTQKSVSQHTWSPVSKNLTFHFRNHSFGSQIYPVNCHSEMYIPTKDISTNHTMRCESEPTLDNGNMDISIPSLSTILGEGCYAESEDKETQYIHQFSIDDHVNQKEENAGMPLNEITNNINNLENSTNSSGLKSTHVQIYPTFERYQM